MKALRLLRDNWVMVVLAVVILVVAAFAPIVQTGIAQLLLSRQTGVEATVGGLSARFGTVEVHELTVKSEGIVLTVPSLQADLPIMKAALGRNVRLRTLVAKGWTLDLRGATAFTHQDNRKVEGAAAPAPGSPPALARVALGSAEAVTRFLRANLARWTLPCDLALDDADLEGDVVLPVATPGGETPRLHLAIRGGGLAAGRDGAFTVDVTGNVIGAGFAAASLATHGSVSVAMATPRTFRRVGLKADIATGGGTSPGSLVLSEEITADAGGGAFSLALNRDGRALASISARVREASDRPAGTWKLDLDEADVAALARAAAAELAEDSPLPSLTAKGAGTFDADPAFTRVHALGRLGLAANQLGATTRTLEGAGALALDADFDASSDGLTVRVDRLSASLARAATAGLAGTSPIAEGRLLQAFDVNVNTGAIKPADAAGDWIEVSLRKLPLAWVPASFNGITLSGGDLAGVLVARWKDGSLALRSTSPLTVGGVSVQRAGQTFARDLDLAASIVAAFSAKEWKIELAPLAFASGGAGVAAFKGSLSLSPGADQPVAINGTWTADLDALAARAVLPGLGWIRGRSASGNISATVGESIEWDGKLAYVGTNPDDTIDATVHVEFGDGRLLLRVPLKVAFGAAKSDATIEATSFHDFAGNQFYLKLDGPKAALEHLKLLHDRLIAAGILPPPAAAGVRDKTPFWGDWSGRVMVMLNQVTAGKQVFNGVAAAFEVKGGAVKFSEGRGKLGDRSLTDLAGSLTFDPAAEFPYRVAATASLDKIEATGLFPPPSPDRDPAIEGRFAIAGTLAGDGVNLDDLVARVRESLKLTSIAGAIRFLKTDVNEAIPPERQTAAGDALGRMGAVVGTIVGAEGGIGSGRRKVSPAVQSAIDVINAVAELAYDEASLTATRQADGTVKLGEIVVVAGDVRLAGSGEIGHVAGRELRDQPMTVDLEFWAKGRIAKLLAAAGLLSDRKDEHGYTALKEPIQLRGTPAKIDTSQWHKLLVEAAKAPPASPKPGPAP